jgi:hypothetical protein
MSISHVKYQFFPAGTTFTQLLVWWLHHLLCYGEYTYDSKLKKFREMFLTTLTHNQHDINDFIWTLPVWNLKIKRHSTRVNLRAMILRGSAGRVCHLENVKSCMSYLQQCTKIIKCLPSKLVLVKFDQNWSIHKAK